MIKNYLRGFTRLAVVAGILLAAWIFVFLAIYGAHLRGLRWQENEEAEAANVADGNKQLN